MTHEENFTKYEKSYRQYYGENYDKALGNLRTTKKRLRDDFLKNIQTLTSKGLVSM